VGPEVGPGRLSRVRVRPGVMRAVRARDDAGAFTRTTAGDCPDPVHPSLRRQSQPVTAVIYTHSHSDHFGGAYGIAGAGAAGRSEAVARP
jgi:alkyl sulfatase BDS1-like metallo-beta-lactamase superfamily hydrolase